MRFLRRFLRLVLSILGALLLLVLFLGSLQYLTTTIYEFHAQKPFAGPNWYNPYQSPDSLRLRTNFHAHSQAWGGLTHGNGTARDLHKAYTDSAYSIHAVSNYFSIDTVNQTQPNYIPCYEHGLNILKTHNLVIDAKAVTYTDYLLYQTPSHQQRVIESIKKKGGLIALAHPALRHGRSVDGMKSLEHYDFVEVLNTFRFSDEHWDAALSAGRLSWLLANDDCHGVTQGEIYRCWTEVFTNGRDKQSILKSLTAGKAVGVATIYQKSPLQNRFVSCQMSNDTIFARFGVRADSILFIGQGGVTKKAVYGTDHGYYVVQPDDTYIRIKSINAETHVYLNPLVRFDKHLMLASELIPEEKALQTWLFRALAFVFSLFLARTNFRYWKRFRRG